MNANLIYALNLILYSWEMVLLLELKWSATKSSTMSAETELKICFLDMRLIFLAGTKPLCSINVLSLPDLICYLHSFYSDLMRRSTDTHILFPFQLNKIFQCLFQYLLYPFRIFRPHCDKRAEIQTRGAVRKIHARPPYRYKTVDWTSFMICTFFS